MTLLERAKSGELLTPEELAELLKKDVSWVYEKRRPRCPNPIPAMPMGRGSLRFEWARVYQWLQDCASKDAEAVHDKRHAPVRKRKKPTAARELRQMARDAREFFANCERDEDGAILCSPPDYTLKDWKY
jgi:hypothetical protein